MCTFIAQWSSSFSQQVAMLQVTVHGTVSLLLVMDFCWAYWLVLNPIQFYENVVCDYFITQYSWCLWAVIFLGRSKLEFGEGIKDSFFHFVMDLKLNTKKTTEGAVWFIVNVFTTWGPQTHMCTSLLCAIQQVYTWSRMFACCFSHSLKTDIYCILGFLSGLSMSSS